MKVTIKTTQQKVFQIELDGVDTIATLKQKIQESQKYDVASQKIIYAGKILSDDKTVESCGIKEKDFLVLMVSKPKPTPASAAASSSTTPISAAPVEASAPPPAAPSPAQSTPAEPTQPASANQTAPAAPTDSSFLTGEALQSTISNMVEMGFPRDKVLRALRASFNNPDRAVEYLMNGIPAHLESEPAPTSPPAQLSSAAPAAAPAQAQPQAPAAQPQNLFQLAQQQGSAGAGLGAGAGAGAGAAGAGGFGAAAPGVLDNNALNALRNHPLIQQLRQQIAVNPAGAQLSVQQLAQQNPGLAQQLANNPEALMNVLGMQSDGEDGGLPPGAQVVSVTPEERAAIERLEALGFPRQAVLEAYFACEKNEELAANYLFEGGFED